MEWGAVGKVKRKPNHTSSGPTESDSDVVEPKYKRVVLRAILQLQHKSNVCLLSCAHPPSMVKSPAVRLVDR